VIQTRNRNQKLATHTTTVPRRRHPPNHPQTMTEKRTDQKRQ
jgi:hypothetical protein